MADASLVLDTFAFKPNVQRPDEIILRVGGRTKGIIGIILSILGLGTHSMITVTRREATFQFTNLGGISYIVCPLDTVRCSLSGVHKPFWALVASGITLMVGVVALLFNSLGLDFVSDLIESLGLDGGLNNLAIISILFSIGFFLFYLFTKNLTLTFSTGNIGHMRGLAFELTMANGRSIEINTLLKMVKHLNAHIVDVKYNGVEIDPNYQPPDSNLYGSSLGADLPTEGEELDNFIDSFDNDDDFDNDDAPPLEPEYDYERGKALFKQATEVFTSRDYEHAITLLEEVKRLNPDLISQADKGIVAAKKRLQK